MILEQVLMIGERLMLRELRDPVLRESLAIIFGGGIDGARSRGMAQFEHLIGDYLRQYLAWCDWLGLKRRKGLAPELQNYLEK